MIKYKCDKKVIRTFRIIITIILALLLFVIEYFLMKLPLIMFIAITLLSIIYLLLWFWYIPNYFSRYRVIINDRTIVRKSGIFFRKEFIMPLDAVQYSKSIMSSFLTKINMRGLNILVIYAYGGMFIISCMSEEDTIHIKDFLDSYIKHHHKEE